MPSLEAAWPWARTTAAGLAPGTNQPLIVTPSRLGKVMVSYGMPKSDGVSGPGLRAGWTTRRAAGRLKFMTRIVAPMAALAAKVRPSLRALVPGDDGGRAGRPAPA